MPSTQQGRHKLDSRASVFLGYKHGVQGYILLDISSREIFLSRNAIFCGESFPFIQHHLTVTSSNNKPITLFPFWISI
ncbi:hypothetical protein JHK82_055501 [Glycine max]|uniref:Retroviral polymerase SH3-like domain-containing protein n=2 Tax=Glycine subgen. Soja TaxID=1462606 RepID=A0A0R0E7M6_SOYBN|nr:hypothetical protein JHK86_055331 [Glycine max]KAG4909479.1 hypothetical protein JHK87_055595 [Glycine soja]KAG4918059.1 hypothetical protein JHK85_056340 [Glycine max]KAG5074136.1 hypothetical protein JHK84_055367 [Glycine max]KAG5076806.1 hypothetical protein JHK82_055501 [Glycine max]